MRTIILIIVMLISNLIFGKTFKNDWANFKSSNWTILFNSDTTSYLGKQAQGQLTFRNSSEETTTITYYVYFKTEIDSVFGKRIKDWMFFQACLDITNGKTNFISFDFGNYYYLLKPCRSCNTGINKNCEVLANQIMGFILKE